MSMNFCLIITFSVLSGKGCSGTDYSEEMSKENHIQEHSLQVEIYAPDNQVTNVDNKLMENLNNSSEIDLPAAEKLLSVPEDRVDQHDKMLPEASPGVFMGLDEGDAGSKIVSGKKRSFTESTMTEQSLNSVESSRLVRFKRTIESVPDDDDLLSSILGILDISLFLFSEKFVSHNSIEYASDLMLCPQLEGLQF